MRPDGGFLDWNVADCCIRTLLALLPGAARFDSGSKLHALHALARGSAGLASLILFFRRWRFR